MQSLVSQARRRITALVLLLAYLPACHSWRAETVTPQVLIETKHPDQVRVVRTDGTEQVLHQPAVVADRIHGRANELPVPLSEIQRIETRYTNVGLTALGVAGGLVVVGLATWVAICRSSAPSTC
jgi:hypothetical protein